MVLFGYILMLIASLMMAAILLNDAWPAIQAVAPWADRLSYKMRRATDAYFNPVLGRNAQNKWRALRTSCRARGRVYELLGQLSFLMTVALWSLPPVLTVLAGVCVPAMLLF